MSVSHSAVREQPMAREVFQVYTFIGTKRRVVAGSSGGPTVGLPSDRVQTQLFS